MNIQKTFAMFFAIILIAPGCQGQETHSENTLSKKEENSTINILQNNKAEQEPLITFVGLGSVKGIGKKSGTVLLSIIGDINDFSDPGKLASFFGVVPRISNSNDTIHQGRITKQGNKLGRTTLVQCTLIAIRYSDYLRSFYERLKARKGSGKAIIATSRKLLDIIYNTLKEKLIFEDFPNFVLKSSQH